MNCLLEACSVEVEVQGWGSRAHSCRASKLSRKRQLCVTVRWAILSFQGNLPSLPMRTFSLSDVNAASFIFLSSQCLCIYTGVYMCAGWGIHVWGDQGSTLDIVPQEPFTLYFETKSLTGTRASTALACETKTHQSLPHQHEDYKHMPLPWVEGHTLGLLFPLQAPHWLSYLPSHTEGFVKV